MCWYLLNYLECFQFTKYNLFAISNHSGSLDFGHYYAQCKIENYWYELNDSKVTKLSELQMESSHVYALFYEKMTWFTINTID